MTHMWLREGENKLCKNTAINLLCALNYDFGFQLFVRENFFENYISPTQAFSEVNFANKSSR